MRPMETYTVGSIADGSRLELRGSYKHRFVPFVTWKGHKSHSAANMSLRLWCFPAAWMQATVSDVTSHVQVLNTPLRIMEG